MKTINSLLLIFLIVLMGCETDQIEIVEQSDANYKVTIDDNGTYKPGDEQNESHIMLERGLQWVSFLASSVMNKNQLAKNEVINAINGDVVKLDILLNENICPNFANEFDYILQFVQAEPETEHEPNKPMPTGGSGFAGDHSTGFYDFILNEHCIELFFPNGVINTTNEFSTTAHPLTSAQQNTGYIRYDPPKVVQDLNGFTTIYTGTVIIDINYVNTHENIVTARPYRNTITSQDPCNYDEFYLIDFTDFLNL